MSPTLRPRAGPANETPQQALKRVKTGHISPTWKRPSGCHTRSRGFQNNFPGNSCYSNSVIQALLHLPKFVNWVGYGHIKCGSTRSKCIPCAMGLLSRTYWDGPGSQPEIDSSMRKSSRCMHRAREFYDARWNWLEQQDAADFLLLLLNAMPRKNPTIRPIVKALFERDETYTLTCPNCNAKSQRTNPEKILTVRLHNPGPLNMLLRNNVFAPEAIADWCCQNCQHVATTELVQRMQLLTTPEILIVQLLRFHPKTLAKNRVRILFPQLLDLTPHTTNKTPARYQLKAVVHHKGSLHAGHYVAVALGPEGKWEKMDDNNVTNVTVTEALKLPDFTPYLLFYAKEPSGQAITSC